MSTEKILTKENGCAQSCVSNELKEKIKKNQRIFGSYMTMGESWIADIYGMVGYDFIWVDTEHSCMDYDKLLNCITILKAHKTLVIVRVQMDNYNHTKRVLDIGPDGIIFPNVETAEYADKCMKSTLYPPLGNRGWGPLRAIRYGLADVKEYIHEKENSLCRFIQLESVAAIKNLPEIVKNPYIDGYIFGPNDLSASIGNLGESVYSEKNMALVKEAIKILKDNGKYIGVAFGSTEYEIQKKWYDMGVNMITSGADYDYIARGSKKNVQQLRELLK